MSILTVPAPRAAATTRRGPILALLCAGQFMVILDFSVVNIALPSMQRALGFTPATLQWVITAYALTTGGFLLLGGRAADLFGRRRMFIAGLALFTLASLAGGLAQSALWMIVARALQGLGAAIVAPSVLSLITTTFAEGPERNRALGVFGALASGGFAVGTILGGILTSALGWRWVLFINVPIGLAVVALSPLLPESRGARKRLDIPGAVTVTAGLASLVYALSEANTAGWLSARTIGLLAVAAALLALFVAIERRTADPLIRLGIFRLRNHVGADLTTLLFFAANGPMVYILTLYLQDVLHYSPVRTGLAFLPHALIAAVAANQVARLIVRVGVKPILAGGAIALAVGLLLLTRITPRDHYLTTVLPGTVLVGLGIACMIVAASIAATAGVEADEQGLASGLFNTALQVGAALGVAVLVAVATARTAAGAVTGQVVRNADLVAGYRGALTVAVGFAVLALVVVLVVIREWDGSEPAGTARPSHDNPREKLACEQ